MVSGFYIVASGVVDKQSNVRVILSPLGVIGSSLWELVRFFSVLTSIAQRINTPRRLL